MVVEGSSPSSNSTGDMMASEIAAAACWERGSEEEVHSSHLRWSHAVLSIFHMFEDILVMDNGRNNIFYTNVGS